MTGHRYLRSMAAAALEARQLRDITEDAERQGVQRQHSHRKLVAALQSHLGFPEDEVAGLVPEGQDWLELDGLHVWWAPRTPYDDGWYTDYRDGSLYVGRPQPGCHRVNCEVPGHEGAHLNWLALTAGSPDFDLVNLGQWLAKEPDQRPDNPHCPYCAAEAEALQQRSKPPRYATEAGYQLLQALARYANEAAAE